MPKAVKGSIFVIIGYIILFFVTKNLEGASLIVPVETLYILLLYAGIGCLVFIFVLPAVLIIEETKKKKDI
ncbi:hypothetical protein [Alteribacillus sp. YIM 98480]|uniref:hypothetical protein n=1 Tax=Alteribacillus sp. YIM 98480 TaxID=2606599 RepID=UPI00131BB272|nr:hypothetical protein [Alteribacillus sp. YIM 98480]